MKLFLISLLILSCSTQKSTNDFSTVSIGTQHDSKLSIEEKSSEDYGSKSGREENKNTDQTKEEKKALVSFSVYSSLYSSLGLVNLFKKIEKDEINISLINANGFAGVICALYAKDKSSNTLEWKLFSLLKKIKGLKPYGKGWKSVVNAFLEDEFGDMNLEQLKIMVRVPQIRNKEIFLPKEGKVVSALMGNLDLSNKINYFLKPQLYNRNLMEYSSDLNFNFVFMPKKIKFKLIDGYSWGIFTNYLGFVLKNKEKIDQINTDVALHIDELKSLSEINAAYSTNTDLFIEKIQTDLKAWKEENTTSSN